MTQFKPLSEQVFVSPQIRLSDLNEAKALGVTLVINNRPDGESPDQTPGREIERAAQKLDLDYMTIPIGQAGFSQEDILAMRSALDESQGKVLAYCRSGTRSALMWSLAEAAGGRDIASIGDAVEQAGYSITPVRATMEQLSAAAN